MPMCRRSSFPNWSAARRHGPSRGPQHPAATSLRNAVTNRPYSGCNVILLWLARNRGWATPRFLTFKQAGEAGGNVRKGEHGTKVYFVKQLRVTEGEGEETETR